MPILLMIISEIQSDGFRLATSTNIFLFMNYLKQLKPLLPAGTLSIHSMYIQTDTPFRACAVTMSTHPTELPETNYTYLVSAYRNDLTITTISLPYYQRHLYLPAYRNHLTITTTSLPYYRRHNCTYLPTATALQ